MLCIERANQPIKRPVVGVGCFTALEARMGRHDSHLRLGRVVAWLAGTLLCASAMAQTPPIDRLVFFGSSLTDSGNSFAWLAERPECGVRLNVPPYDQLDDLGIPEGPYAVGGHHVTNGATWAEGLARSLGLAGNARPAFVGAGTRASNYAVGGARAIPAYPCRFNLPEQVSMYLGEFPQTSPNAWVGIEIGSNDVRDALEAASKLQDPAPYLQNALASLGQNIGLLHAYGARRFFLLNVPDIGKTPAVRSLGPAAVAGGGLFSALYNEGLVQLREQLLLAMPGIDVRIVDLYATLNAVVADPQAYGFANATDPCVTPLVAPFKCQRPDGYVFWDGIHPTKAMHALVARQALATIQAP
jgi:phospholipase/lecithinase/hemolysin